MHPDTPTGYFKTLEERYHIEDFHPHKLRHTYASVSIAHGADIASVSETLGHADKTTTLRMYTDSSPEARKRTHSLFNDAIRSRRHDVASGDDANIR